MGQIFVAFSEYLNFNSHMKKNPPSEKNRTHDFTQQLRSPTVAHSRLSVRRRDLHKQCYYYQPSFWAAQAVCLAASLPVLPALLAKNRWTQTKQTSANFNFLFAAINLVSLDIRLRYIQSNLIYVHTTQAVDQVHSQYILLSVNIGYFLRLLGKIGHEIEISEAAFN